jgi:hypothetical protein
MFKLKKILNKHNNAPEFELLKISSSTVGEKGAVYALQDGELCTLMSEESHDLTYYVSFDVVEEMQMQRETRCFRITPDMIFEVKCESNENYISCGDKFVLVKPYNNFGTLTVKKASEGEESDGYIVGIENYPVNKTVLVRFHCNQ